jgi:hypothetical protein
VLAGFPVRPCSFSVVVNKSKYLYTLSCSYLGLQQQFRNSGGSPEVSEVKEISFLIVETAL